MSFAFIQTAYLLTVGENRENWKNQWILFQRKSGNPNTFYRIGCPIKKFQRLFIFENIQI